MSAISAPAKVLLTGASGFIAAQTVKSLVGAGFSVVGTVRSASKGDYLAGLFGNKFTYSIVKDLESETAFDDVVQNGHFDAIIHMASPVTTTSSDPKSVIGPAVVGTKSILQAALKYGPTVKRVILTGSVVCVFSTKPGVYTYTESDYNTESPKIVEEQQEKAPGIHIYRASKTLGEQAAWKFIEDNKSQIKFDFVVLHPPLVFGPVLQQVTKGDPKTLNETSHTLINLLKGSPEKEPVLNYVDVRTVAEAHVLALTKSEAAGQRFIISAGQANIHDWKSSIEKDQPGIGKIGAKQGQNPVILDSSKSASVLGIKYRPQEETLRDSLKSYNELFPDIFKV